MRSYFFTIAALLEFCHKSIDATQVLAKFESKILNVTAPPGHFFDAMQNPVDCANKCLDSPSTYYGFYVASGGKCNALKKKPLHEVKARQLTLLWFTKNSLRSDCNSTLFPHSFGNSSYFVERTNTKKFEDAVKYCDKIGGKLAQLSTDEERLFVANISFRTTGLQSIVNVGLYWDESKDLGAWKWKGSSETMENREFWGETPDVPPAKRKRVGAFSFKLDPNRLFGNFDKKLSGFVCECMVL